MTIPLLDLQRLKHDLRQGSNSALQQLNHSCCSVGFFALHNHSIDSTLFSEMRAILQRWFSQSESQKRRYTVQQQNYRGFIPLGMFTPNQDVGSGDLYEGYKLHFEIAAADPICAVNDLYGPNRWPEGMPEFRETITRYWQAMDEISDVLLQCFASLLQVDSKQLLAKFSKPLTNMTLLHYPPTQERGRVGIHPHKDTDIFTLLYPDAVGGLQLRTTNGQWIDVQSEGDALIVNVGNMLEIWSGGRFLSTPHRVINQTGQERYSFPYFVVPRHDVMIEPIVEPLPGFQWTAIDSGTLSAEVWRTNWPDELPQYAELNLGSLQH